MRRALLTLVVVFALSLVAAGAAWAVPTVLTLSGCPSCAGMSYSLSLENTSGTTWHVIYTISSAGYNGDASDLLADVGFKIAPNAGDLSNILNASSPTGYLAPIEGDINAAGGCGAAVNGFICFAFSPEGGGVDLPNGDYIFSLDVDVVAGKIKDCGGVDNCPSLKAEFLNADGSNSGLLSDDAGGGQGSEGSQGTQGSEGRTGSTEIPEPGSLVLLGLGILAAGVASQVVTRRRSK